ERLSVGGIDEKPLFATGSRDTLSSDQQPFKRRFGSGSDARRHASRIAGAPRRIALQTRMMQREDCAADFPRRIVLLAAEMTRRVFLALLAVGTTSFLLAADLQPPTWLNRGPGPVRALAADPNNAGTLYAIIEGLDPLRNALFKSTDRGENWRKLLDAPLN